MHVNVASKPQQLSGMFNGYIQHISKAVMHMLEVNLTRLFICIITQCHTESCVKMLHTNTFLIEVSQRDVISHITQLNIKQGLLLYSNSLARLWGNSTVEGGKKISYHTPFPFPLSYSKLFHKKRLRLIYLLWGEYVLCILQQISYCTTCIIISSFPQGHNADISLARTEVSFTFYISFSLPTPPAPPPRAEISLIKIQNHILNQTCDMWLRLVHILIMGIG